MFRSILRHLQCKCQFQGSLLRHSESVLVRNEFVIKQFDNIHHGVAARFLHSSSTSSNPIRRALLNNHWLNEGTLQNKIFRQMATTTSTATAIPEVVPSTTGKKRIKRKQAGTLQQQQQVVEDSNLEVDHSNYPVVAYATCDEINLEKLKKGLIAQGLYVPTVWANDSDAALHDVIHVLAKYPTGEEPREVFFFRDGSAVFWNVPELERNNVLKFIKEFQVDSYSTTDIMQESEFMLYTHGSNEQQRLTKLVRGKICLSPGSDNLILEKYTVANAMALSVKLGIWESTLDKFVDSIDHITEELKAGTHLKMTRAEVLIKTGELFSLRNELNLSSDLLDTPDFYWEHEELENLYHKMYNYLSISRRTGVMNEKLSQCCEFLELVTGYLNDRHHVRLEWMIIALIMVEVVLGLCHFVERYTA